MFGIKRYIPKTTVDVTFNVCIEKVGNYTTPQFG